MIETFHEAHGILPGPGETDGILRVNGKRDGFASIINAVLVLGCEAPHLTAGDGKSIAEGSLAKELTLPQNVAVALAAAGIKFRDVGESAARIGNAGKWRVDIGAGGPISEDGFGGDVAARGNTDAAEANGGRPFLGTLLLGRSICGAGVNRGASRRGFGGGGIQRRRSVPGFRPGAGFRLPD